MCEKLDKERQKGKEAAQLLAEHLVRMNAAECEIEVDVGTSRYFVFVKITLTTPLETIPGSGGTPTLKQKG